MGNFQLIEHTADIGVIAWGNTLGEAFASAGLGLFSIITDITGIRDMESRDIELRATSVESLLFSWINELIYIFEVDHLLFSRFDIKRFEDNMLTATAHGEKYNPGVHVLKLGVKSATFHMLSVDKINNRVQVILDI